MIKYIVKDVSLETQLGQKIKTYTKKTTKYQGVEYKALKYTGLNIPNQICSIDVPISSQSWIHEIICGFENKQDIVLLPGYGGSSMTYIRLFKELSKKYRVHALDLLGTGLSHRSQFKQDCSTKEAIDYYIDSIEKWRKQLNIKTFVLAGHSFGGYLSSCYAQKYPEVVTRLILISPPGCRHSNPKLSEQELEQVRQNSTFGRKMFLSFANYIKTYLTPSKITTWPIIGTFVIDHILTEVHLKGQQKQAIRQYSQSIFTLCPNSQKSFFKIFYLPKLGLNQTLSKWFLKFYFGEKDWLQKETIQIFCRNLPFELKDKVIYTKIKDSGHHIIFDASKQLIAYILT